MSYSYFRYTTTLSMYRLHASMIPRSITFPNVTTLALLQCDKTSIPLLLSPIIFPSLKEIHYLSGHPGSNTIHRSVSEEIKWIFPNYDYLFYNTMIEAGYGIKSDTLLSNYISKELDNDFELYIPQYKLLRGEDYRTKLIKYMNVKMFDPLDDYFPRMWKPRSDQIVDHPINLYIKKQTEDAFLKCIL